MKNEDRDKTISIHNQMEGGKHNGQLIFHYLQGKIKKVERNIVVRFDSIKEVDTDKK